MGDRLDSELGQRLLTHLISPGAIGSLPGLFVALVIVGTLAFTRVTRKRELAPRVLLRAWLPPRVYRSASARADIAFTVWTMTFSGAVIGGAVIGSNAISAAVASRLTILTGLTAPVSWPPIGVIGITTIVVYLAYEFAYWSYHFISHRFEFLWRFHAVHHSAESLSTLTNFRVHPVDSLIFGNVLALVNGIALGCLSYVFSGNVQQYAIGGTNVIMVVGFLVLTNLQHSHFWITFPGLWGNIFLSPAHHQIHHSKDPAHYNKNLGSTLALWDWLFGTLHKPARMRERLDFGVEGIANPHGLMATTFRPISEAARVLRPRQRALISDSQYIARATDPPMQDQATTA